MSVEIDGVNNIIKADTISEVTSANGVAVDGLTIKDGGIVGATTIITADNTDTLTLTSTDTDVNVGPNLRLYRNSSNPQDNNYNGAIQFEWRNDNSQDVIGAEIQSFTRDASDGTEDNILWFQNMTDGTLTEFLRMDNQSGQAMFVVNENSVDIDFRVESNNNDHMLFVDGGNDHVNIGTSTDLGATLNVKAPNNTTTQQLVLTDNDNQTKTHIGNFSNQTYITNNTHYNGSSWVRDDNGVGTSFIGAGDGTINFGTSTGATPTNRWVIDSTGNLVPQSTSLGIYLGVSSATAANLLDDYEEGTWTPAWATGFYAENGYLNREGFYTKVGRLVTCQFSFRTNTSGWTSNGNQMTISGVPFTMLDSEARAFGISGYHSFEPTAVAQIYGNNNSTVLQLYKDGDESFTQGSNHTAASGKYFIGGFSFITA